MEDISEIESQGQLIMPKPSLEEVRRRVEPLKIKPAVAKVGRQYAEGLVGQGANEEISVDIIRQDDRGERAYIIRRTFVEIALNKGYQGTRKSLVAMAEAVYNKVHYGVMYPARFERMIEAILRSVSE